MTNNTSIWHTRPTVEQINTLLRNDVSARLGVELVEVGDDFLRARLPVDDRTTQPFGLLHGGVSCVVSEMMGSMGSNFCVDAATHYCVGIEINASHVSSARSGFVHAETRPLRIGARAHFWETRLSDAAGRLVCVSRLTTAVMPR